MRSKVRGWDDDGVGTPGARMEPFQGSKVVGQAFGASCALCGALQALVLGCRKLSRCVESLSGLSGTGGNEQTREEARSCLLHSAAPPQAARQLTLNHSSSSL